MSSFKFSHILSAIIFLFAWSVAQGLNLPDGGILLKDGGALKTYEIACDELHCSPLDGVDHPFALAFQKNARRTVEEGGKLEKANPGVTLDLVLYEKGKPRTPRHRRSLSRRILIKMDGTVSLEDLAKKAGSISFSRPQQAQEYGILKFKDIGDSLGKLTLVRSLVGVGEAQPLLGVRSPKSSFRMTPALPGARPIRTMNGISKTPGKMAASLALIPISRRCGMTTVARESRSASSMTGWRFPTRICLPT